MKLFVAAEPPDDEQSAFSYTIPGELVHFPPLLCDCPDCGCDQAMAGFVSRKATTSFVVRDLDIDADTYTDLLFESLRSGGWVSDGSTDDRQWVSEWAVEHMDIAADLPVEKPLQISFKRVMVGGGDQLG